MSRVPHVLRELRTGVRLGNIAFEDPLYRMGNVDYNPVSVDAGVVALEYGVSREQQDEWAYLSQMKHREAKKAGKWEDEILPIEAKMKDETVIFDADEFQAEHHSRETGDTEDGVRKPTVTAGNAPGINDGAAAMVLIGESKMNELGIEPLAELVDFQFVADRYQYIPIVPGKAIKALLEKRGLSVDDLECMEINEAFAAGPLVSSIILVIMMRRKKQRSGKTQRQRWVGRHGASARMQRSEDRGHSSSRTEKKGRRLRGSGDLRRAGPGRCGADKSLGFKASVELKAGGRDSYDGQDRTHRRCRQESGKELGAVYEILRTPG
jgi:hypothetical protein